MVCLGWTVFAQEPSGGLAERLDRLSALNHQLERRCDFSLMWAVVDTLSEDLAHLAYSYEEDPGRLQRDLAKREPGMDLVYLRPFWQVLNDSTPSMGLDPALAGHLGLKDPAAPEASRRALYELMAEHRLWDVRPDGTCTASPRVADLCVRTSRLLDELRGKEPTDVALTVAAPASPEPCPWAADVRVLCPESGTAFPLLSRGQVSSPGPDRPRWAAFFEMAFAEPEHYETGKWFWHGVLIRQMNDHLAGMPADVSHATADRYVSLALLLSHAGLPASVFRAPPAPLEMDGRRIFAFASVYEEDLPHQLLFSEGSHLEDALLLVKNLSEIRYDRFNPIRHLVCFPFDVIQPVDAGSNLEPRPRPMGYAGYLDALAAHRPPTSFTRARIVEASRQ